MHSLAGNPNYDVNNTYDQVVNKCEINTLVKLLM